jgi:Domain of unknown function (DUF1929)/Glyoxal oxidase N-terminus/Galactose oxidase, central domain
MKTSLKTLVSTALLASVVGGLPSNAKAFGFEPPGEGAPLTVVQQIEAWLGIPDETDDEAPVDYGPGPGKPKPVEPGETAALAIRAQIPVGASTANVTGVFGPVVTWPIIPIHAVLLPDGRVMNYGTNASGQQGAQLIYDIWDPKLGTGSSAHLVLPNTTKTDIFCGSQSLMMSGDVLTSGGDLTVSGARNSAQNATTIFSPTANSIKANTPMNYARWYSSLVSLPNGELAVFGGRQNVGLLSPAQQVNTPELYDPAVRSWKALTGATADHFGGWYYPRAYVAPGGSVFVLSTVGGAMYSVSTAGAGSIVLLKGNAPTGNPFLPTVPFAPGMAISVRMNQQVVVVDYRKSTPIVTATQSMDQIRYWASGSILADGQVLVTGGSQIANQLTGVAYHAQIWNPATGHWTAGASATKPRLYHSISMLLPDATVLTGGGGAPGPVKNLNAEIYYPPYLYASNGKPAVRPVVTAATPAALNPGNTVHVTVGPTDIISRLTFVRTGSVTHSNNSDQRILDLAFTQEGQNLTAVLPTDTTRMVPGFYMLFAFNDARVPSVARMFSVM